MFDRFLFALACAGAVAGCVSLPEQGLAPEPRVTLPDAFSGADAAPTAAAASWRELFTEPELVALIEATLAGNRELAIQSQEAWIADYRALERSGEYIPRLDGFVGAGIEKVGETTSQGAADEANDVPEHLADFRFGLAASWEVDLWRRMRNLTDAARLRALGSREGRQLTVTALVAEVAASYYELTALDAQRATLERNIAVQTDALELMRIEKQAARVTELAVQRFEAEVLRNQSLLFELQQRATETENRLHLLAGRPPEPISRVALDAALPDALPLGAGVPTELLENRPDVRRAELLLEAAELDVAAARARFYPSLSVESRLGYESYRANRLLHTPASLLYDLAGGLVAPLLNRRALTAEYWTTIAEQWIATLQYEQTVLQAYYEVANQISSVANLRETSDRLGRQVALLQAAIETSTVLFRSARADYVEVLLTRREALDAELERVEVLLRQRLARVQLYRALGGGWRSADL